MTARGLFVAPFDALADPTVLADLAAEAEYAGWDGLFVWDHLLYSPPVQAIADPWICCAAIAVRTTRLRLGPMVTPLSRRRPHVLARQAVTLDRLSSGRLVLGFGLGDDGEVGELSRFDEETEPRVRGARLDEGLDLLRDLLSGTRVQHVGGHFAARGVRFRPDRAGRHPVLDRRAVAECGAVAPGRPLRGAFVISLPGPDGLGQVRDAVAAVRAGGLDGFDVVVELPPGESAGPWAEAGATWLLTRVDPYDIDLAEARRVVRAGPY